MDGKIININREILRLSVPAVVSNITVPLLGLCDTAISGHLGSELFLAAIAVGSMMLNVVFWLFGFLRMGTTGLTAKAFGAGNEIEVRKVFTRALTLGISVGILLIAFQIPLLNSLGKLIGAEENVRSLVATYFSICIWEAPSMLATMTISGWFVGMQSTLYPMIIAITVNIVNIIASLVYVYMFGMGFEGIAYGTLTANWFGLLVAMVCVFKFSRGKRIFCGFHELIRSGGLGSFFSVNANLFFRSACIISVSLGVTAVGARLGAMTLAVNAVLMQFFTLFSFFMDGIAFSAEALTGRYAGANDEVMLKNSVRHILFWGLMVALTFTVIYMVGFSGITGLLTDDAGVRVGVYDMRVWIWLLPIVSVWAFLYDGFYVGITMTGMMLRATLVATLAFFIISLLHVSDGKIGIRVVSNHVLWSAFLCYLFMRGAFLAVMWRSSRTKAMSRAAE
ncbi:MAG: MATE family efflux transporter [Bacteroides sp.]|nr:MATE family efflux transporter [Bacteroides sp.]